ncbi:MAG: carbohydrate-binding family 9-like protein [Acidobacteria bacterium]|nr:carbohydrate-binding family 9-like protein [Acidobacteriota bacterium]
MTSEPLEEKESDNTIEASYTSADVAASDLDHPAWNTAHVVAIKRYWSGEDAPIGRHAEARLLWSKAALCVRFVCHQTEPLVINLHPQTKQKTLGLWDRDVCELFIAPDASQPECYFEFEAAPTGEWLDVAVCQRLGERESDWDFHSGMTAAARVTESNIMIAMRVPWEALGRVPQANDRWRGNLFRCVGADPTRGYLAWRPTHTEEPGFHVPAAFGWIRFLKQNSGVRIQNPE